MRSPVLCGEVSVFPTSLGWVAFCKQGSVLVELSFGHQSPAAAVAALRASSGDADVLHESVSPLVERLQAYANGAVDDFADLEVDLSLHAPFARRVLVECRRVAYGETISYAELAARVGSPRAARAVGGAMAANRVPLVVPCHRIVGSNGGLGGYSAVGGLETKRRLLALESHQRQSASGLDPFDVQELERLPAARAELEPVA